MIWIVLLVKMNIINYILYIYIFKFKFFLLLIIIMIKLYNKQCNITDIRYNKSYGNENID